MTINEFLARKFQALPEPSPKADKFIKVTYLILLTVQIITITYTLYEIILESLKRA